MVAGQCALLYDCLRSRMCAIRHIGRNEKKEKLEPKSASSSLKKHRNELKLLLGTKAGSKSQRYMLPHELD